MAENTPPHNGRDRVDAQFAGQKIGLSTNNLIAVLFIGLIGVLLWMFWGSGQVIMQRDIADRHRIAQEHQEEFKALRQAHEVLLLRLAYYHEAMSALWVQADRRLVEQTHLLAKWFLIHDHNTGVPQAERIPFGVNPPWLGEELRQQQLPRKE